MRCAGPINALPATAPPTLRRRWKCSTVACRVGSSIVRYSNRRASKRGWRLSPNALAREDAGGWKRNSRYRAVGPEAGDGRLPKAIAAIWEETMSLFSRMTWMGAVAVLALSWAGAARADDAADTAVKEAQKYRGQTITVVWEAGLQSLDPEKFSGPKWEALTGIKVKVIEVQTAEMFTKIMQEYRAGTGAYDAWNVLPAGL